MYNLPLLPGTHYHIFNHAVGDENLFRQPANYLFFLERYTHYILPVAQTYACCLMPNHFHLLVRIREKADLTAHYCRLRKTQKIPEADINYATFVMQQFSNFCNSYARAFNRRFDRRGALFVDYIRRKPVTAEAYFTTLLAYIHGNPVRHGFCRHLGDWPYSSFHSISSQRTTRLERQAVLDWFGGIEPYVVFHQQAVIVPGDEDWEFGF